MSIEEHLSRARNLVAIGHTNQAVGELLLVVEEIVQIVSQLSQPQAEPEIGEDGYPTLPFTDELLEQEQPVPLLDRLLGPPPSFWSTGGLRSDQSAGEPHEDHNAEALEAGRIDHGHEMFTSESDVKYHC